MTEEKYRCDVVVESNGEFRKSWVPARKCEKRYNKRDEVRDEKKAERTRHWEQLREKKEHRRELWAGVQLGSHPWASFFLFLPWLSYNGQTRVLPTDWTERGEVRQTSPLKFLLLISRRSRGCFAFDFYRLRIGHITLRHSDKFSCHSFDPFYHSFIIGWKLFSIGTVFSFVSKEMFTVFINN